MVYTTTQLNDILRAYVSLIVKEFDVEEIWLFGSYVHGTPTEDSDIDLAVVSSQFRDNFVDPMSRLYRGLWDFYQMRNRSDVPNIEVHGFSPEEFRDPENFFGEEIQKTGKCVWKKDEFLF
ncbi:MAG: nucleotidyltransferase domain-containing protein [Alicyclobacillaceae bacterium]|nr:nucleotidyltransferase domain-containing protein [Alicyclobacillaceae bacterium]